MEPVNCLVLNDWPRSFGRQPLVVSQESPLKQANEIEHLKSKIATLPPDLLTNLEQAMVRLDMDTVNRLIDEVRLHHAAVADRLATLADDFRYDEILTLIRAARNRNEQI